ncbi:MAG: hypothetical protein RJQ00_12180 [Vicingaceae bacterium]
MAIILLEDALDKNAQLLIELAKRLGVKVSKIKADDKEDLILGQMMLEEETNEYVSREEIDKILEED